MPSVAAKTTRETVVPLAVDLDGTLIRSDMMWESLVRLLRKNPFALLAVPFWWMRGRAYLKQQLAARVRVEAATLPYNEELLLWLREQKAAGRKLVLATASDVKMAEPILRQVDIFDELLASDGKINLRDEAKLKALTEKFGPRGFDYAGNSSVDLDVWKGSREAIVVNAGDTLAKRAAKICKVGNTFPRQTSLFLTLIKSLRPHQWVKNLIIFVPIITSHNLTFWPLLTATAAFMALCLCASGGYVLNDLLDLDADRHHPTNRRRPFASGALPLSFGLILIPVLLGASAYIAWTIHVEFLLLLGIYLVVTSLYSSHLKRVPLLDVFVLAGLYTLRLVAGHVVTGIEYSAWLLMFSMFIFLSLALMKRFRELRTLRELKKIDAKGRGYTVDDVELVATLGLVSGYLAALVLALYVNSAQVVELYQHPLLLLLICPLLLYWVSRVWFMAHRGQMDSDPVLFALKDWPSYAVGLLALMVMWLATGR